MVMMSMSDASEADPRYVVLAGDWHGNALWALHVIETADCLLQAVGEERKIIIQLGDFGFYPEHHGFQSIADALRVRDMELWWLDGNHEYWPWISSFPIDFDDNGVPQSYEVLPRIRYLPRGTRWTWAGRIWLAVGGAVSVDRLLRQPGVSWWPEEELTASQAAAVIAAGPADVLLAHDCPAAWLPPLGIPAQAWIPELPRAHAHSLLLERVARACGLRRVFHGHYHVASERWFPEPDVPGGGGVHVNTLALDGYQRNMLLADVTDDELGGLADER